MLKIYVTGILLACMAQLAFAQKAIIISDSLVFNADMLPVVFLKMKNFNVFPKLTYGDYALVSGKWGFSLGNETSNVWGTKSKDKSSRKFSFTVADALSDTVKVKGVLKTVSETITPLQVSKSFSVGSDQQIETLDFSANIEVTGDTAHVWTVSMKTESGGETVKYEGFMTDGKRTILITPLYTSQYELPAYGYEFTENDKFYSAYLLTRSNQTYTDSYRIYLERGLTAKMKMALSGAMVALLEAKKAQ